jgi:Homeodomain-like domain
MLARHAELGLAGLKDGSRAPKVHPNQTPPEVEAAVLRVRKAHPTWGSKKILWALDRERPDEDWPARSTVEEILKRAGVVEPRDRRLRRQPCSPPRVEAAAPNDVWSMEERPHEALGMKPPAEVYELSPRQMPRELQEHSYETGFESRSVRSDGSIKWDGEMVFVGEAFAGEVVGIRPFDEGAVARPSWAVARRHPARPVAHHRAAPGGCHPCARTKVSPMFPVAPSTANSPSASTPLPCSCRHRARTVEQQAANSWQEPPQPRHRSTMA